MGIAGEQTGIYPLNSPGGWHIIGQTPLQLFDATKADPVLLKMGDRVTFLPISLHQFYTIQSKQKAEVTAIKKDATGIIVLKQGIADTVQDLGRYGHQHVGINPTGAMDIVAAQIANFLVGNTANKAVLELHFPASVFQFQIDTIIALSGADFTATINDNLVPINTPIIVSKNSVLSFTKLKSGARCYVAVSGGFIITPWLNSCSTNLKANAGGYYGRLLQKNDTIAITPMQHYNRQLLPLEVIVLPWQADVRSLYDSLDIIHVIAGNEHPLLCDASDEILVDTSYTITTKSDRMGYRLQGLPLQLQQPYSLISTAVTKGTIQLLPDGQLIILMADHQTIGGYPRIGHVAQYDMPKLAQMQAHQQLQLQLTSQQHATEKLSFQQQYLLQIQNACIFKLNEYFGI